MMKKSILFMGLAALMLSACAGRDNDKANEDSLKIASLTADYQEATSFNDSLMLLMGDIYSGLDSINTQEGLLYNMTTGEGIDRRAEIRNNLASIKARLAANKQLLLEMEQKVNSTNQENSVQARTIAQLKQHIEQQDAKIARLEGELTQTKGELNSAKGQIETLNTQVSQGKEALQQETSAKEQAQEAATVAQNEAATVYYAIGTNKELKTKGLLEKKFLGSTKVLQGNFDATYFVKADKRTLKSIPTNSKKVKVWTNMPEGSYRIVGEKDGPKTIEIVNPDRFWSLTNHLVIQID